MTELDSHPTGQHVCPDLHHQLSGFIGIGLLEWKSGGTDKQLFNLNLYLATR